MYLKSLELHGFKSFPDKTVLTFERGATIIIGPNGSGKSNISDAMKWVLGEMSTKSIRGNKMEDVIFGGADTRRPMGYAEVSVTFDNTDKEHRIDSPYDEITVTRRYYRSGDSDYYINRKEVRLRDIHEMFMNTGVGREGYSIIGQGKISEILSKKSEDRRTIFEEAAGISKYRYRKTESERKLAETEANMLRIYDVLSELEGRVGPLEKESERAKKYLELYEEKKRADVSLWIYDTERVKDDVEEAEKAFKLSEHELEMAEDSLKLLETQSDRLFEESQQKKLTSEKLLGDINQCSELVHKLESEYKVSENEIEHNKLLIGASDEGRAETEKQIAAADAEIKTLEEEKSVIDGEAKTLETEHGEMSEKQMASSARANALTEQIDEKFEEIGKLDEQISDYNVRINVLLTSHTGEMGKCADAQAEIDKYGAEAAEIKNKIAAAERTIAAYDEKVSEERAAADKLAKKLIVDRESAKKAESEVSLLSLRQSGFLQRADTLARMEEHFEGYSSSVRYVMQEYDNNAIHGAGKIYGPLSKLIDTDKEYITAVETALGNNIQNIVTDNEETAKAAIKALRDSGNGRATFYPISSITPQDETAEMRTARGERGYIGGADELVRCDAKFDGIVEWLLGRTLVFDDLDNAIACAKKTKYRVKLVTLDGQVINAGGSFTGGSVKRDSGIMSRGAQIESLRAEASALDGEIKKKKSEIYDIEKLIKTAEEKLSESNQQIELISTMAGAERSALEGEKARLAANEELTEKLKNDIERITGESESYEKNLDELRATEKALTEQRENARSVRASLDAERGAEEDACDAYGEKANEILVKLAEKRAKAEASLTLIRSTLARISQLKDELLAAGEKASVYREKIADIERSMNNNSENRATLEARLAELTQMRSEAENDSTGFEKKLNDLRLKIREKTNDKELVFRAFTKNEAKLAKLKGDRDRLAAEMLENYELTFMTALALNYPKLDDASRPETAHRANKLKNEIRALGNVNIGAIEEYADVKTRYDEMTRQINDLKESKDDLEGVIAKIEGEMKRSFSDAFEKINKNFGEVFSQLFGGGQAELSLTDPENVLTSGIEIKAAPPGKIIKSLMLLSGGEQAFVAIALFFAVLRVNPSPFCILDEIEAALDEVNVARFADYIKNFEHTQFILITHRRGTMEAADRMYGVTMPEQGVSKVIPLNVYEFEKRKGEFSDGVF